MEGSSLPCDSAGTDPVHSPETEGDDFTSGELHCLASFHPRICMERNRRSVIAGDILLQDTEVPT